MRAVKQARLVSSKIKVLSFMAVNDGVMNDDATVGGFDPRDKYSEPGRSLLSKWSKSWIYGSEKLYQA